MSSVTSNNCQPKRFASPIQLLLIFLIFFAVGFALLHKGYQSNMVYDSAAWIVGKEQVFATHDLLQVISIVASRALFMLSLYANYALTGMDPYYFRLTNTAILAGAGLALAWLILVLLEIPVAESARNAEREASHQPLSGTVVCCAPVADVCGPVRLAAGSHYGLPFLLRGSRCLFGCPFRAFPQ